MSSAWGIVGDAPAKKAEGLLPQVHDCSWCPLWQTFLLRHVYSGWMSEHISRTQSGQFALNLDTAFCPALVFPRYISCVYQATVVKSICSKDVLGKVALLRFTMCLLIFRYTFF